MRDNLIPRFQAIRKALTVVTNQYDTSLLHLNSLAFATALIQSISCRRAPPQQQRFRCHTCRVTITPL